MNVQTEKISQTMTNQDKYLQQRNGNPFVGVRTDEFGVMERLYELKFGLIFYLDYPPGPKQSRAVLDLYVKRYGSHIARFMPTTPGSLPRDWTPKALQEMLDESLPALRQRLDWGYGFDDGNTLNSYLFMFHGFRPYRQKGRASFFRFEFPWDVDQLEVRDLAIEVANTIPFNSGSGGFFLQVNPSTSEGYDAMYAICNRYWGIEAWNLDVTVNHVLNAYKTVNWLTLIGNSLGAKAQEAVQFARQAAFLVFDAKYGTVLQASDFALLGDRNRRESMTGYVEIARSLRPLQVYSHGSFGGERWNEANSIAWIRRFTDF